MVRQWLVKIIVAASLIVNAAFGWSYYSGNTVAKYAREKIDLDRGEEFFCTEKEVQAAGFTKAYGCE